jgi:protein-ribulosamine 3-kinase
MEPLAAIARELRARTGLPCAPAPHSEVGGGSIHTCYRWPAGDGCLFVKRAPLEELDRLAAEAEGLDELAATGTLRVPQVRALGQAAGVGFLALEWFERAPRTAQSERRLGEALARLHRITAERHGWRRDNYLGRSAQHNTPATDWVEFFRERRLRPQLALAAQNGFASLIDTRGERLLERVPQLLEGHRPQASLLHGDLWGGNWLTSAQGVPVIYDPAVYFGDRETDLAMTQLFGGFGPAFYQAYAASAPLGAGAPLRAELYNLYHLLNHLNLFGAGYAAQACTVMERLLAAVRS